MPRVSLVTRHTHGCINPIFPKSRWSDDCFNNVQWISQNALNAKLDRFTYCNNLYFSLRRWTLAIGNLRWSMEFPSMVGAWLRSRSHWLQASSLLTARQSRLCLGSLLRTSGYHQFPGPQIFRHAVWIYVTLEQDYGFALDTAFHASCKDSIGFDCSSCFPTR